MTIRAVFFGYDSLSCGSGNIRIQLPACNPHPTLWLHAISTYLPLYQTIRGVENNIIPWLRSLGPDFGHFPPGSKIDYEMLPISIIEDRFHGNNLLKFLVQFTNLWAWIPS